MTVDDNGNGDNDYCLHCQHLQKWNAGAWCADCTDGSNYELLNLEPELDDIPQDMINFLEFFGTITNSENKRIEQ